MLETVYDSNGCWVFYAVSQRPSKLGGSLFAVLPYYESLYSENIDTSGDFCPRSIAFVVLRKS